MILLGTSGFSYDDWRGNLYPAGIARDRMFDAYKEWFNAVEINSSFYRIPPPRMMEGLVRRAGGRLSFAVKMSRRVTHDGDLGNAVVTEFSRAVEPAAMAGSLTAVLLQFPFRFHNTAENRAWLHRALAAFKAFPLAVEIRHDSWQTDDGLRFFADHRISLCIVDMPRLRGLPTTRFELTGPLAYVRFHGRNEVNWFQDSGDPSAPYNYHYEEDDLREWVEPIRAMERKAQTTLVFFNNHVRGQAPDNALALGAMLEDRPPPSALGGFLGL